ncbi:MAG: polyprenyl synthetase family protein [Bacteroidales bacterium]
MIIAPPFLLAGQQTLSVELDRIVPPADREPSNVHRSIRYTLLGPSKRVRGVLTLAVTDLLGGSQQAALAAASAIELVHASSLILDDLPAMDDTNTRRGRPANHVEFGEATAILAAVGLLNLAFGHVAASYDAPLAAALARVLSETIGSDGLIGGQAADLELPAQALRLSELEPVHHRKTAVLFQAAARSGALVGGASQAESERLAAFGDLVGLAFQIADDVLDIEHDKVELPAGGSSNDGHRAHVAWLADPEGGRRRARELAHLAIESLASFGDRAGKLRALAGFLVKRTE